MKNNTADSDLYPDNAYDDNIVPLATKTAPVKKSKRKKLFGIFAVVLIVIAASVTAYWELIGSKYVSTDNAYVQAEIAIITPSVDGIVKDVAVNDTQAVKTGDILVTIDDTDAKLALEQSEAELSSAERRVRAYLANDENLSAQINAREADQLRAAADLKAAEANFKKAQIDLDRRKKLSASGSVSGEELTNAQNAYQSAEATLASTKAAQAQALANKDAAVGSLNANTVLTSDTTVETNPEVALARARRDQAKVDLERTIIRSPVDGIVAQRQVQLGQRIQRGATLMAVVPLDKVYVDANFKEVQLQNVKIGQPVELKSDLYGSNVVYHGKVAGFSGGTGSAFALIPAQNATGNWIKVVQRLPVRIELDANELKAHQLQVGLSMEAEINISGK